MKELSDDALRALLMRHAPPRPVPFVPSLQAFAAVDELPLWLALEEAVGMRVDAPFFVVVWPGAQAVARAIVEGTVDVLGRAVLEVGCGSGLASVAAACHGARTVWATDVDRLALQATRLTAHHNDVAVCVDVLDLHDDTAVERALDRLRPGDVVIAADVVYNAALGAALTRLVRACRARGLVVVAADSGRPFFEQGTLVPVDAALIEVPRAVEGAAVRRVTLYRGDSSMAQPRPNET